jgi:cytoskeletal protein RodZ
VTRRRSRALVGAKLKKARERHGISLRQVADSTKISVPVLQALERDDISYLPGGVVGRGFVRSFAAAVNLDPEKIVAEFVEQFPLGSLKDGYPAAALAEGNELVDARPSDASFKVREWDMPSMRRIAAVVVPSMLVVYLAFETPRRWPPWDAIPKKVATAAASLADVARGAGSNERPVRVHQPPAPPPAAAVPAAVEVPASSAAPPIVPKNHAQTRVAASKTPVAVTPTPPPAGDQSPAGAPTDKPLKVVLSATSPSWVIASVDGKKTVNRLLDVGEEEIFVARRELVLTAGNGGALVMTLNGSAVKSLGRAGETVKVHINHANFKDYLGQ